MALKIRKAAGTGFCFGVKRALEMLEKASAEHSRINALGALVHNQQVMDRLESIGVRVVNSLSEAKGDTVAIGAHGVTPQVETEIRANYANVINTTCPFVHRAQIAARRLSQADCFVIVYGDVDHVEVKGILGYINGKGLATLDGSAISRMKLPPRRLGVLSQTTQIPEHFTAFVKDLVDSALTKDAELRIIDTICHDIRDRQQAAFELAKMVDLMLVIGSHTSANTNHLASLCSTTAKTYMIETGADIKSSWFRGKSNIGVTGGASTAEDTIDEVVAKLEAL